MNNWNKLLYRVTGLALLDPQKLQDCQDKGMRVQRDLQVEREGRRNDFKANQEFIARVAAAIEARSSDLHRHFTWALPVNDETVKAFILAYQDSKILAKYNFPLERIGYDWTYVKLPKAYPAEAQLEFFRWGLL